MPALGQPASTALLVAATVFRTVYGALGAYLTAWIARDRPMLHVLVIGSLGLLANVAGTVSTWQG